jgi:hypothetical protein
MAMTETITILGIAGSLRRDSYNRAALRAAQALAPRREAMTEDTPRHTGERRPYIWIFHENISSSASLVTDYPAFRRKQRDTGHPQRNFLQGDVL